MRLQNLPQLAARLAGGFVAPITVEPLDLAIQQALEKGGFVELKGVRRLPGRDSGQSHDACVGWTRISVSRGGQLEPFASASWRSPTSFSWSRASATPGINRSVALALIEPNSLDADAFQSDHVTSAARYSRRIMRTLIGVPK